MSSYYSFHITYGVPSDRAAVRKTLETTRSAVEGNWRRYADAWSPADPGIPADLDAWMVSGRSEGEDPGGPPSYVLSFPFSPVSDVFAHLVTGGDPSEQHALLLSVLARVTCGDLGEREARDIEARWDEERRKRGLPPSPFSDWTDTDDPLHELQAAQFEHWAKLRGQSPRAWPVNRACLLNVIKALTTAFPAEKVTIYDPSTDTYGPELPREYRDGG